MCLGSVVLDVDFNAQNPNVANQNPIVPEFLKLLSFYQGEELASMVSPAHLVRRYRRSQQARKLNRAIQFELKSKFNALQTSGVKDTTTMSGKSVLALSWRDVKTLSPTLLNQTTDQIKTFLLAGHDTTSILIQWTVYQLSLHPTALSTIRAEVSSVLGSSVSTPDALLSLGPSALDKLVFTAAVIKETLRLYPPAASARWANAGEGLKLMLDDGREAVAENAVLYICEYAIQRDEKVYGSDAAEWKPERWLVGGADVRTSGEEEGGEMDQEKKGGRMYPATAWRPFERGPRACIGQELANLEARVILACVVGRYDFEKVGMGAMVDGKVEEELLNVSVSLL
jgi:cytochrome P450